MRELWPLIVRSILKINVKIGYSKSWIETERKSVDVI